jgi:hypothetical protein
MFHLISLQACNSNFIYLKFNHLIISPMKALKILAIFVAGISSLSLFAQKVPEYTKKIYVSPEGKVFIQKSLPVYLMLGIRAGDKNNTVQLQSESMAQYTNPMYLDAEGLNTIRHPWAVDTSTKQLVYPKRDIVYEIYADSKSPVTKINYGNSKILNQKGKLFVNGKTEITLTATDQISGVEKIMYSIDSADYQEYTKPIVLENEKEYSLKFFSFDHVGNVEQVQTVIFVIDKSAPKTSMEIKGDYFENNISGNSAIILKCEDISSGIESLIVKLDDLPEQKYPGPIKTSMIKQGEHKLVYYSTDNVENREELHSYDFYVDKTPPTLMQDIIGKSFMLNGREFSSGQSQLKLTALDNKAGVKEIYYSINNGEFKLYENAVVLNSVGGNIKIKSYAVDKVNNRSEMSEESQATSIPYIDLSGPALSYSLQGPAFITTDTLYISNKTRITLKAFDNEAGVNNIRYQIDGKEEQVYSASFQIEKEGIHVIEYTGTDNVENTNSGTLKLMVDNSGPDIYARFSTSPKGSVPLDTKTLTLYPGFVGLFVAATDIDAGYDHMTYSLNGSKDKPFTGFLNSFPKNNQVVVKAYDKLGNESITTIEFAIKN